MARINLTTVAREAGVAMSTASLVLNGRAATVGLAEETVRRIRETAERLGYAPNHNARSLSLRRSGMVGVILAGNTQIRDSLMDGIRDTLDRSPQEMVPLLGTHDYRDDREFKELRFLLRNQVEAIIATPKGPYKENYAPMIEAGVPVIFAIHSLADAPADGPSSILLDNFGMARDGYLHLAATGVKRIAYLAWDFGTLVSQEKLLGVQQAVKETEGRPSCFAGLFMQPPQSSFEAVLERLFANPATAPDALLCNPVHVALHCLDFLDRRNISVPRNCSVLSLNDHELLNFKRIPVTAMVEDATVIGRRSAEVALDLIASPKGAVTHERLICHHLIERETTLPLAHPIS